MIEPRYNGEYCARDFQVAPTGGLVSSFQKHRKVSDMIEPRYNGEYCALDCWYLDESSIADLISNCTKYKMHIMMTGVLAKPVRCEGCVEVSKPSKSEWTKEIPTEPGWYPAIEKHQGCERVLRLVHEYGQLRWYWGFAITTQIEDEIEWWGPRIEFPEAPKGDE